MHPHSQLRAFRKMTDRRPIPTTQFCIPRTTSTTSVRRCTTRLPPRTLSTASSCNCVGTTHDGDDGRARGDTGRYRWRSCPCIGLERAHRRHVQANSSSPYLSACWCFVPAHVIARSVPSSSSEIAWSPGAASTPHLVLYSWKTRRDPWSVIADV